MRPTLKLLSLMAALSVGLTFVGPPAGVASERAPSAQAAPPFQWEASIIPAEELAIGSSLPGGDDGVSYGYDLVANGITGWYTTCSSSCGYRFAIFTFTNEAVTAGITFKIVGPSSATVYNYTWPAEKLPKGADWFWVDAKGDFGTSGNYDAGVYGTLAGGKAVLLGWIPLLFTPK
jgi:hypothetical protein